VVATTGRVKEKTIREKQDTRLPKERLLSRFELEKSQGKKPARDWKD